VVSDTYLLSDGNADEEIPMDERSADIQSLNGGGGAQSLNIGMGRTSRAMGHNVPPSPMRPTSVELHHKVSTAPRMPTGNGSSALNNHHTNTPHAHQPHTVEDDVSSLGGVEESNVVAMTTALRSNNTVLHGLSPDESILWDTVQCLLLQDGKISRKDDLEQMALLQDKLTAQQTEHERALRAIQRVLADVTEERDKALEGNCMVLEEKKQGDEDESDAKENELASLQDKLLEMQNAKKRAESDLDTQKKQNSKLKRQLTTYQRASGVSPSPEKTVEKSDSADSGDQERDDNNASSDEDLKKQLDEKSAALENAKMIITSLENASGSLANDTRLKLKSKEAEIENLQSDVQHYKRKLDTLATELRESQRVSAEAEEYRDEMRQLSMELKSKLETTLGDLRSASCILETTHDPSSIQNLAEIFSDCSESFRMTMDVFERNDGDDSESDSNEGDRQSTNNGSVGNISLREELQKVKEEALHYKLEAERIEKQRDNDVKTLYAEIQLLRVECTTNMDVLAKKERELGVLRDSLKVDDDGEVGYISDDATEGDSEEEDSENPHSPPPPPPPQPSGEYTPSQAEALATLLAHGGKSSSVNRGVNRSVSGGGAAMLSNAETNNLKGELAQARMEKERFVKELRTERESLANAKMIISSLEKANKSMMEDLRLRLNDSNTAIASLLEKSMESEKTTAKLQAELEVLRTEKAKNEEAIMSQQGATTVTSSMATETID